MKVMISYAGSEVIGITTVSFIEHVHTDSIVL